MPRSLVLRVTALIAAVIVLSFGGWAVVLHRATSAAFVEVQREVVGAGPAADDEPLRAEVESAYRDGGATAVAAVLARNRQDRELLVVGTRLDVLAASAPQLEAARVTDAGGGALRVTVSDDDAGGREELVLVVDGSAALEDAAGRAWGRLLVLPAPTDPPSGAGFAATVWRGAALWLVAILAFAVVATTWVVRRSLAPVDRLTRAARELQGGRIPAAVAASGDRELVGLVEAFNDAVAALARTEALRRRLVADVAHELRTPVTNLRAQLEACEAGLLEPGAELLATLRAETRLLERLVDDVQQLAASDAGRLELRLQPLPLLETARNVMQPLAAKVGAELVVAPSTEVSVLADEERLRQILSNLTDNAARHRDEALVLTLAVRVAAGRASLRFADNGPGIDEADRPHVFDRFYRAERSRGRSSGGAGLGLAIVKGLVEAMGGSIRYDDGSGPGAAFTIELPRADG